MEKDDVICGTAGLLGLLAVILAFVGEGTKSQSFTGYDGVNCVYRSTVALGWGGVVGAFFLLTAHVFLTAATGCCRSCRPETRKMIPSQTKRVFAVPLSDSVVSWILLFMGLGLFFNSAMWNIAVDRKPAEATSSGVGECYVLQGGLFAAASVMSLVIVGFGIASYFLLGASAQPPEQQQGIAMGQPPPYFQPEGGYPAGATWQTRV